MRTGTVIGTEHAQGLSWFEFSLAEVATQRLLSLYRHQELEFTDTLWTNYRTTGTAYAADIQQILTPELEALRQCLKLDALNVRTAWFELGLEGSWHAPHTHGNRGYSAVVYLEFSRALHAGLTWRLPENDARTGNERLLRPQVDAGIMLVWPSSWLHWTDPQTTDQRRLVLSFNLEPRLPD